MILQFDGEEFIGGIPFSVAQYYSTAYASSLLRFLDHNQLHTGHAVAQLVDALRYKPEGRGFDSQWLTGFFH
jgi:hypothetical protein